MATLALTALVPTSAAGQVEAPSGVLDEATTERAREDTLETARGIAMGSGSRATATGTSALAYNNANLALLRLYHVEAGFQYITGRNAFTIGSAVADSISSALAAGFSFRGFFGNGRDYNGWDGRLGLGMALAPAISLGLGARFLRMSPRDRDDNDTPIGEHARGFTLDASATVTPIEWLHFSVLAYNLIDLDSALAPVQIGGSLGALVSDFGLAVGADVLVDISTFSSPRVLGGFGLEYTISDIVPVRLGYRRDGGRDVHTLTLGAGYFDSKFEVDFALRHDLRARARRQTELMLTVRYNVQ
ncbi:MAG: hypothetical protein R3B40_05235 [Polyangiales bacterium]|nr:hypothetical protein [Myxococcales bacterium]MCB9660817.1 hypothetical protein [Sandaracinaceae bacterium]